LFETGRRRIQTGGVGPVEALGTFVCLAPCTGPGPRDAIEGLVFVCLDIHWDILPSPRRLDPHRS
jgi:hypothetical protein